MSSCSQIVTKLVFGLGEAKNAENIILVTKLFNNSWNRQTTKNDKLIVIHRSVSKLSKSSNIKPHQKIYNASNTIIFFRKTFQLTQSRTSVTSLACQCGSLAGSITKLARQRRKQMIPTLEAIVSFHFSFDSHFSGRDFIKMHLCALNCFAWQHMFDESQ